MIAFVKLDKDDSNKEVKTYRCSQCGTVIATSKDLVRLNGAEKHSFVNPSRIQCIFMTFSYCENVLEHQDLFPDNSWFTGYGWRFLLCGVCFHHVGWKYDALKKNMNPEGFYGVLVDAVQSCTTTE
jgi:hypothetical protein